MPTSPCFRFYARPTCRIRIAQAYSSFFSRYSFLSLKIFSFLNSFLSYVSRLLIGSLKNDNTIHRTPNSFLWVDLAVSKGLAVPIKDELTVTSWCYQQNTHMRSDDFPETLTDCVRPRRNDSSQDRAIAWTPNDICKRSSRMSWSTVSMPQINLVDTAGWWYTRV